jgi:hypothetical protein
MSIETWRRLWILDKLRQNRFHHFATQQGLQLRKPPHRTATTAGAASYELPTATHNARTHRRGLRTSTADDTAFQKVDKSFLDDAARTEVMIYLSRTYGPRFVGKMIQHLPNSRSWVRPDR